MAAVQGHPLIIAVHVRIFIIFSSKNFHIKKITIHSNIFVKFR
jgi:hypothetical protein